MVRDVFGIVGKTLAGAFKIEEAIAEGGFGVVYRAEHVAFRAPIALKCLKIPGTITDEQRDAFVENFREEAELLFHLSHQIPEVVRPLHADAMTLPSGTFMPFIAMEWVEGTPLDSIIILREERGQRPLSLRKVIRMLTPIAHALAKAHHFEVPGGGVVSVTHRDLKPENILITEPGAPCAAKILDFGIAKARDKLLQGAGRITNEGGNPFTPSYGSPEQWLPKRYGQTGPWTDVWGLSLTLVECLTGFPPIDGDMHAMMGTALDESRRPTPRNEGVDVSDDVEALFTRALAVDPKKRIQSIGELWGALETAVSFVPTFGRANRRPLSGTFFHVGADEGDEEDDLPVPGDRADDGAPSGRGAKGALAPPLDPAEFDPAAWDDPLGQSGLAHRAPPGIERAFDLDDAPAPPAPQPRPGVPGAQGTPPPSRLAGAVLAPQATRASHSAGAATPQEAPERRGSVPPEAFLPAATVDPLRGSGSHPAVISGPAVLRASGAHPAVPGARDLLRSSGAYPAPTASVPGGRPTAHELARAAGRGDLRDLKRQLRWPVVLVLLAVVLTVVDFAIAGSSGQTLALGPIRVRWIAIALAVAGIGLAFYSLVVDRDGH